MLRVLVYFDSASIPPWSNTAIFRPDYTFLLAASEVNQGCGRCRVRLLVVHEVYFSEMTYAFCLCGLCKNPDQIQRTLLC